MTFYSLEPTLLSTCATGNLITFFDIRTNTSVCPNTTVNLLGLKSIRWKRTVQDQLEDRSYWSSNCYVRLGSAFGNKVAIVDELLDTVLSVRAANQSGFIVIFSGARNIQLLSPYGGLILESPIDSYSMNLITLMEELYNFSDRDMSWTESNRDFQRDIWNFVSDNLLENLTAFMDSRICSHLIVEDLSGDNLLIHAARHQRSELVTFLIDRGVLVNHQNTNGETLHVKMAMRSWLNYCLPMGLILTMLI